MCSALHVTIRGGSDTSCEQAGSKLVTFPPKAQMKHVSLVPKSKSLKCF